MSNNGHGLSPEIIEQLKEQMDLARVKTRKAPGGGVVPYIEGADAISTANRIFNFNWSSQLGEIKYHQADDRADFRWNPETQKREATGEKKSAGIYYVTVSVSAFGVTKTDVGRCICDGNGAEAHDMAIAGAVTDGLKRALRQFGDQFGNALYDKESDTFREAMQGQQPAWGNRAATPPRAAAPKPPAPAAPQPVANTPTAPQPARPPVTSPRPASSAPSAGGTNRVRPAPGRPVEQIIPNSRRSNTQLPLDD